MSNYVQPNQNTVTPAQASAGVSSVTNGNPQGITTVPVYVENVSDADDPHLTIRQVLSVHKGPNNR